jgi:hypothetical protein
MGFLSAFYPQFNNVASNMLHNSSEKHVQGKNFSLIEVIKSKMQGLKYTKWQEEVLYSLHLEYSCH